MYVQLISNQSGSACPAGNCAVHRVPVLPVLHAALAHGTGCRGCAAERRLGRRENVGQGRPTRTGGLCHVSRNKKKEESRLSSSGQHGRATQSCTGAFLRLPGKAATQQQRSLARAPFRACQARQQRGRTQSRMGSLFCLAGEAAIQQAATQQAATQNAVLHGLLVLLARGGSNTIGEGTGAFLRLPEEAATQQRSLAPAPFRA